MLLSIINGDNADLPVNKTSKGVRLNKVAVTKGEVREVVIAFQLKIQALDLDTDYLTTHTFTGNIETLLPSELLFEPLFKHRNYKNIQPLTISIVNDGRHLLELDIETFE